MGPDGRVTGEGSVSDALAKNSELAEEVELEKEAIELDEDENMEQLADDVTDTAGKLVIAEEIEEGHVSKAACAYPLTMFMSVR